MPELPEVETVRRGLQRWVAGRSVGSVQVAHPRAVRRHLGGPTDFAGRLTGRVLLSACRRGKYLWLPLGGDRTDLPAAEALLGHLGMSGQLVVKDAHAPSGPHLRVRVTFVDGPPELRFLDQRTFGGLAVVPLAAGVPAPIAHLAPDPLEPAFDDGTFVRALRRRRTGLKRALLDQTLVSGIGNIYADEALWRARLHYARATDTLPRARAVELLAALRSVLVEALTEGGTSFDALYVDVNGRSGYFERSLAAYGRAGLPCRRCGTAIRREPFMNRSSFRCPRCQRRPAAARW
jgi:formamidopyrimidine-DNA glycosylase